MCKIPVSLTVKISNKRKRNNTTEIFHEQSCVYLGSLSILLKTINLKKLISLLT